MKSISDNQVSQVKPDKVSKASRSKFQPFKALTNINFGIEAANMLKSWSTVYSK